MIVRLAILLVAFAATSLSAHAGELRPEDRRSDTGSMSTELQAMQADDSANPASLWVLDGEALWTRPEGSAKASCSSCHGDAAASMRGVSARYPSFDARLGRTIDV